MVCSPIDFWASFQFPQMLILILPILNSLNAHSAKTGAEQIQLINIMFL